MLLSLDTRAQPLADRLPASTLVYVGWSPNASLQTTATAKMLADERIMGPWRRIFQDLFLDMPDALTGGGGDRISAQLPFLLTDAAQCEGCFAMIELKQAKRRFNPQSILMIELGAKRKSFEEHFKPVHARMKERVGERLKMLKLDNSWVWVKPDREGKAHVTWGFVGDTFVCFLGDAAEEFIPKLVKGTIGENLKAAPAFVDAVGKIPGDSVLTTYLDTRGGLDIVKKLVEREGSNDLQAIIGNWDKLLGELGLDNVKGMAEKTVIEDRQFVTRSLLRTDGAPRGLLSLAAQQGVDPAMMKVIPQDAMVAVAGRLDLATSYDQIKRGAINIAGNDARDAINQLEQGAEGMGLPVKSVLEALGDQWVVYNAGSHGGFAFTGWTLVCNVRDKAKLDKTITTLRAMIAKMVGGGGAGNDHSQLHAIEADGLRIEYMEFGRWGAPFSPAWAVVDDKLVVALYPQLVEDAAKQIRDPDNKSLLDNPDYLAARKRIGDGGPLVYTSGPEVTKNLYPVGLLLVSFMNSFGGGFNGGGNDDEHIAGADLLPSMQRLIRYVGTDAVTVKATPDGVLKTRTVGNPLISPLFWADSPVLWLALGIPTIAAAEDATDRITSASNLRQIGQAVLLYGNENKGKFPPDLATLTKTQDLSADALKSPFGPAKDAKGDIVLLNFAANPTAAPDSAAIVIAYDQAALEQGDGTNVLYADGHVDWLPPETFAKALEEAKKKAPIP
jgi:prepilin-type processing-associated H-X9-DG protein